MTAVGKIDHMHVQHDVNCPPCHPVVSHRSVRGNRDIDAQMCTHPLQWIWQLKIVFFFFLMQIDNPRILTQSGWYLMGLGHTEMAGILVVS